MKKFANKLFIYFSLLAAIAFTVEEVIDNKLQNLYNDTYGDWNRIFNSKIDADIVILGSSRAWVHYNPEIIEKVTGLKCYNLGIDGAGLQMQRAKWASYIANNKPPKIVIQDIDLITFGTRSDGEIFDKHQFLPYLKQKTVTDNLSQLEPLIQYESLLPLIKYRGYWQEIGTTLIDFNCQKELKTKGFQGQELKWDGTALRRLMERKSLVVKTDQQLSLGYELLNKLAADCTNHNIKLVLVHSPIYKDAIHLFPQQESFICKLNEYTNSKALNFTNLSLNELSLSTENFYNATHLNAKGSENFSNTIAKQICNILN